MKKHWDLRKIGGMINFGFIDADIGIQKSIYDLNELKLIC